MSLGYNIPPKEKGVPLVPHFIVADPSPQAHFRLNKDYSDTIAEFTGEDREAEVTCLSRDVL